jgi:nucleoside-diphosphate-sugar epimerase
MCLRPVAVWDEAQYRRVQDRWRAQPDSEWKPFWEYGAFVDARDVAAAVDLALTVPLSGHHRVLLCADEIAGTAPSLELAARLAPGVPVTDPGRYLSDPYAALLDCRAAETALGWKPTYRWSGRGTDTASAVSAADPPRPARPPTP